MQEQQKTIFILGGDGYLGWSLGLGFANRTDLRVVLVDNLIKRTWEKNVGAKLLVPLAKPSKRIAEYKNIFGKTNLTFEKLDLLNADAIVSLIKKYRPFAIINAAQQPSAPFSMMNAKGAAATFTNNIVGHVNTIWAITEIDRDILYLKLGSAGCYSSIDTEYVPLSKKDFEFNHNGAIKKIANSWLPMHAHDFYHQSKIADFLIDDLASDVWKLKIVTVQQATIYGATIAENEPVEHESLVTRFNYDETFGTVINRFVCQIAIDHPLTVYGDGEQRTGVISLSDTIDNFMKFSTMDVARGEHAVVHNVTDRLTIKEIVEMLQKASGFSRISFIDNPRKEMNGALKREVERHVLLGAPHVAERELASLLAFAERYKENIDPSLIMPKVKWERAAVLPTKPPAKAGKPSTIFEEAVSL